MAAFVEKVGISIHALRGEGDGKPPNINQYCEVISIHALRGEGDIINRFGLCVITRFQSTPSVGRATRSGSTIYKHL